MWKHTSFGRGKDVSLFEKALNRWHRAAKTSKITDTTKTGLRRVQRIIKNWKDGGYLGHA